MLSEDDEGGEARGSVPDEAGVGGEPGDVALVPAVEEDGPAGAGPPTSTAHQVPLLEERLLLILQEAEVVQTLPEVPRLVLVVPNSGSHPRPRPRVGAREAGRPPGVEARVRRRAWRKDVEEGAAAGRGCCVGAGFGGYEYETQYFRQCLDHFSFLEEEEEAFFKQRYLVGRAGGWADPGEPIFFCGNEGDITWFATNSGLVWDAAPCFSALVVFAEHRYYGEFLPFGSKDKAYNNSKSLAYLTAEQALAENAVLLTELKRNLSAEGSPVVLFGGSYGGMLAAWMRLKYLHITVGALASSAPILQFEDIVPSTIFYDLVSDDFKRESVSCFQTIKDSWKALDEQGNSQDGLLKLSKTFHLCQTLKTTGDLSDWLSSAYSYLAMVDYPMPSDFLMPLPTNPIKEVCRNIDNQPEGTSTLERIYAGVNVYYNYTGTVDCFDLDDDPHGMGGWDWQACTEMVMPMSYIEGAHHIDLRPATKEDPDWLVGLRES